MRICWSPYIGAECHTCGHEPLGAVLEGDAFLVSSSRTAGRSASFQALNLPENLLAIHFQQAASSALIRASQARRL